MEKAQFINHINYIVNGNVPIATELYMCIKENGKLNIRRLNLNENTERELTNIFLNLLNNNFLDNDIEIKSMDDIDDNQHILYSLTQNDAYCPFDFLKNQQIDNFNSNQQVTSIGYIIKIGTATDYIYLYQGRNNAFTINNDKTIILKRIISDVFVYEDSEYIRIDRKIDVVIIGDDIFSSNIKLLERTFGLEKYIRQSAKETIRKIEALNIMSSTEVFFRFETKLKNSKKLMKIKDSPVFKMSKDTLLNKISQIERYKQCIVIQNDKIVVNTQIDAENVIKLFADAILKSELTDEEYESMNKKILERIN